MTLYKYILSYWNEEKKKKIHMEANVGMKRIIYSL